MTIGRIIVALDSIQNQLVIMMLQRVVPAWYIQNPWLKKTTYEGGEVVGMNFSGGSPLVQSTVKYKDNGRIMVLR